MAGSWDEERNKQITNYANNYASFSRARTVKQREVLHDWEITYDNDLPFRGNIARNTSTFPEKQLNMIWRTRHILLTSWTMHWSNAIGCKKNHKRLVLAWFSSCYRRLWCHCCFLYCSSLLIRGDGRGILECSFKLFFIYIIINHFQPIFFVILQLQSN